MKSNDDSFDRPNAVFLKTHYETAITLLNKKKSAVKKDAARASNQAQ